MNKKIIKSDINIIKINIKVKIIYFFIFMRLYFLRLLKYVKNFKTKFKFY
jgi:hypothetical protein